MNNQQIHLGSDLLDQKRLSLHTHWMHAQSETCEKRFHKEQERRRRERERNTAVGIALLNWLTADTTLTWVWMDLSLLQRWASGEAGNRPYFYLTEQEVQRISLRVANGLNTSLFQGRARRKTNPDKLHALIVAHDVSTRRHLHCLFGLPPTITPARFKEALGVVLAREPFTFGPGIDGTHACIVTPVRSFRRALFYAINPAKSRVGQPIAYVYARPFISGENTHAQELAPARERRDADRPNAA